MLIDAFKVNRITTELAGVTVAVTNERGCMTLVDVLVGPLGAQIVNRMQLHDGAPICIGSEQEIERVAREAFNADKPRSVANEVSRVVSGLLIELRPPDGGVITYQNARGELACAAFESTDWVGFVAPSEGPCEILLNGAEEPIAVRPKAIRTEGGVKA